MTQTPMPSPTIGPLGDQAILIRFGTQLTDAANRCAVACARRLWGEPPAGTAEIAMSLVSVLVRYDARRVRYEDLAGDLRLVLATLRPEEAASGRRHLVRAAFGGEAGPDLAEVAERLDLGLEAFVARHNAAPLRVLSTGFAPGFVYCGLHGEGMHVPRRATVRASVPPGTLLFAAGQTAITATSVPTGWHVIGRTAFRNFDPEASPPTVLGGGDAVAFEAA
jgi:KipI family sensor histidine kinase inhibitor